MIVLSNFTSFTILQTHKVKFYSKYFFLQSHILVIYSKGWLAQSRSRYVMPTTKLDFAFILGGVFLAMFGQNRFNPTFRKKITFLRKKTSLGFFGPIINFLGKGFAQKYFYRPPTFDWANTSFEWAHFRNVCYVYDYYLFTQVIPFCNCIINRDSSNYF